MGLLEIFCFCMSCALLCHVIFSNVIQYHYPILAGSFHVILMIWLPPGRQKTSWSWRQAWRRLTDILEVLSGMTHKSPRNHSVVRQTEMELYVCVHSHTFFFCFLSSLHCQSVVTDCFIFYLINLFVRDNAKSCCNRLQ